MVPFRNLCPPARLRIAVAGLACLLAVGCLGGARRDRRETPAAVGLNTRDLVDPPTQEEFERRTGFEGMFRAAAKLREQARPATLPPKRSILCLSGGGSYGAYSAGVLCGWTAKGGRPQFDTVTGISTGALIAVFAFLGPSYDGMLKRFYTTLENRDLFKLKPVRGLIGESFADNAPLARQIDATMTPQMVDEIAIEHSKGRRLYVGTTEMEGRRFVLWDIGAIASRGTAEDRELIKLCLLGSSAIPGFFPPARIPVVVDGRRLVERHVDGGVSQALFMAPPHVPPEFAGHAEYASLYDTDVYCVVAGKLYVDSDVVKPRSLSIAGKNVSTIIFAQTRGDLTRIWTVCQLTGMNFRMAAIPEGYAAPKESTEFDPKIMRGMFDEGVRQVCAGTVWRTTPPGAEFGESHMIRSGPDLTWRDRRLPERQPGFTVRP